MFLLVTFCVLFGSVGALTTADFLPFGTGTTDQNTLHIRNLFSNTSLLDAFVKIVIPASLPSFRIFGTDLGKDIFINFNGHITFGVGDTRYNPTTINVTKVGLIGLFAAYFSDNDLRRPDGVMYYRLTNTASDLNSANTLIRGQGFSSFSSSYCVVATWIKVKYYVTSERARADPANQGENTYQIILCTNGLEGHVIYHYEKMAWAKSQASDTNYATVGWKVDSATDPSLREWYAPSSGTANSITTMVSSSNIGVAGRWMRKTTSTAGPCVGKSDGLYSVNCTHYMYCCKSLVEVTAECPTGTNFHQFNKYCVDARIYPCGSGLSNFCDGKSNGRYQIGTTTDLDDFYSCTAQLTHVMRCPYGAHAATCGAV